MSYGNDDENSDYKQYLSSCNIDDVSPRVLRRLRFNQFTKPQELNVEVDEENIKDSTEISGEAIDIDVEDDSISNFGRYAEDEFHAHCNEPSTSKIIHEDRDTMELDVTAHTDFDSCITNAELYVCEQVQCTGSELIEEDINLYNDLVDDQDSDIDTNRYHSFKQFTLNANFRRNINVPLNVTEGEMFLMVIDHCLRSKSSFNEICSFLRLINTMFSRSILPDTRHTLDKICNSSKQLEFHGICSNCGNYIGKITNLQSSTICKFCLEEMRFTGPSSLNIFVIIDPTDSIRTLLEENDKYYHYIMNDRRYDGFIKDIYDGKLYRSFQKKLPSNERRSYASTIFNTDGAPRFESSQFSIWPVYLQLNEIPTEVRYKRIITCGMWFGRNKPEMTAFLQPFTNIMKRLATEGIKCNINRVTLNVKVYALVACVDSVARAPMQGVKLFNGQFGCNWCLHKGEWYEGSTRYPILQSPVELRTNSNMLQCITELTRGTDNDVYGVLYASPLINLPYFDIAKGFVPDYLHCCLAGVGKQVTKLFLNCITAKIEELSDILLQIKVPHQLGRTSRSFKDMSNWKGKEWENFILYYSIPLFKRFLSPRLVTYWTLFVDSLYTLLKNKITPAELDKADEQLHMFAFYTEKYFTKKAMTYNVHQLLHISESVLNWGPLHSHSTFPFESANYDTLQAIHSAKGVNLQIVRFINLQHTVQRLRNLILPNASILVQQYCAELTNKRIQKSCKFSSITYLGSGKVIDENNLQNFVSSPKSTLAYVRAVKNGCLFASCNRKNLRTDNSFAMLKDKTFVKILYFLVDNENKQEITLCYVVNTSTPISDHILQIRNIGQEIISFETNKLESVCVLIKVYENSYIVSLPNLYFY